eukprot:TRINITY_DN1192_c0_g1_i1.p1 TRINITY_DN1192_c0_g1~~TRINITY_DN1192_c0_g1_i1.p1  ORF type:complete len:218 (-),score=78.28 TRINITY_DN1192_c0_g1_i1:96-749(-)
MWDEEDFATPTIINPIKNNWDDEEDEAFVPPPKAAWDEEEKPLPVKQPQQPSTQTKKKETVNKKKNVEPTKILTKEELRERELLADYDEAQSLFSGVVQNSEKSKSALEEIDALKTFEPKTKLEFEKFADMITQVVSKYQTSLFYREFLKNLLKQLTSGLLVEDLKELVSALNVIMNDKVKKKKTVKKKGVAPKITAKLEEEKAVVTGDYDEFEDFM